MKTMDATPLRGRLASMVLALCATAVAGCGGDSSKNALIGVWKMDRPGSLADRMMGGSSENTPSSAQNASSENPNGDDMSLRVEFARDGRLITRTQIHGVPSEKRGSWRVVEAEGSIVTVEFELDDDGPQQIEVEILDEDSVRMVPPNLAVLERAYTFSRIE